MYTFIQNDYQDDHGYSAEKEITEELEKIVRECQFLRCNWGMVPMSEVTQVAFGHKGPVVRFKGGDQTWWYNVEGGYKLES